MTTIIDTSIQFSKLVTYLLKETKICRHSRTARIQSRTIRDTDKAVSVVIEVFGFSSKSKDPMMRMKTMKATNVTSMKYGRKQVFEIAFFSPLLLKSLIS